MSLFDGLKGFFTTSLGMFSDLPYYHQQTSRLTGDSNPKWLSMNEEGKLFDTISELQIVISRKASMFSNLEWRLMDTKSGEVVTEHPVLDLLNQPNPVQGKSEWLQQFKIYEQLYGSAFTYKLQGSTIAPLPSALWNLPSQYMSIDTTGKIWEQFEIDGVINSYDLDVPGTNKTIPFEPDTIMHRNIPSHLDPISGTNKTRSLKYPLSNTVASYEHRNVVMDKKGAIGILSKSGGDQVGALPLSDKERSRLEKAYQRQYGISKEKAQVIISSTELKWQAMSFPLKDMLLHEEGDFDFLRIVDLFGLNANIFSRTQGATFENQENGIRIAYQDTIIPEANDFAVSLTKFLKLKEQNLVLSASFEHLPMLQMNRKQHAETTNIQINSVVQAQQAGLIEEGEARLMIENLLKGIVK